MPELPDVETMRRGVSCIQGATIQRVQFPRCRYRPILVEPARPTFRKQAQGQRIVDVTRVGKRIVLVLGNDRHMVFEPRMTGLLLISDPPDKTHLRLGLQLEGGRAEQLLFWDRRGLGTIRLLSINDSVHRLGPRRLGPDALVISAVELRQRLETSQRPVKVALLDQKMLAGIGNLYASEILHVAKISPVRRCTSLRPREWRSLQAAMRKVLRAAIKYEGSTLEDGTYRNALNQDGTYQKCHRVYKKTGELCASCANGRIRRIVQAQRSTFYCASCQR